MLCLYHCNFVPQEQLSSEKIVIKKKLNSKIDVKPLLEIYFKWEGAQTSVVTIKLEVFQSVTDLVKQVCSAGQKRSFPTFFRIKCGHQSKYCLRPFECISLEIACKCKSKRNQMLIDRVQGYTFGLLNLGHALQCVKGSFIYTYFPFVSNAL